MKAISNLDFESHFEIIQQINDFWLSSAEKMKSSHASLFPMYFSSYCKVLRKKDKIVSYLYALPKNSTCFIHLIATRKGHYRQGCAKLLYKSLEKQLISDKFFHIEAFRLPQNRLAEEFFHKLGFEENNSHPELGESLILMRKKL